MGRGLDGELEQILSMERQEHTRHCGRHSPAACRPRNWHSKYTRLSLKREQPPDMNTATNRATHHLQTVGAEMAQQLPRRSRCITCLRNILRRPKGEKGHHVFAQHDLERAHISTRDGRISASIERAGRSYNVRSARQNHSAMRRMAEDQE